MRPSVDGVFVSGEGCWLRDGDGIDFFDATAGSGAVALGHQHPAIVEAVVEQARLLIHTGSRFGAMARAELVCDLADYVPFGDASVLLTATGAEAVEAGLKVARAATGRRLVVSFRHAFHGKTSGALAVTWRPELRAFASVRQDEVLVAELPTSPKSADSAETAIDAVRELIAGKERDIAAFILEPVQITEGVLPAGEAFLDGLQELADRIGSLLILDEIYTGFGRTGSRFFSDRLARAPDILLLGKALGNGLPIAAVTGAAQILNSLPSGAQTSTYSAHPLSCAAARAVIAEMRRCRPWESAARIGSTVATELEDIAAAPYLGAVRVSGAAIGVDIVTVEGEPDVRRAAAIKAEALRERVLLFTGGYRDSTVKLVLPLTASDDEIGFLCHALRRAFDISASRLAREAMVG